LNKRWGFFYVDNIAEIEFNTQAFKSLVLPRETKEMIYSLVKIHATDGLHFDDLIKGKGKGIVFLLHGPPGVGKTLTAGEFAQATSMTLY
jgi:ATP-dependent 26S proteasome regulatory subunit